MPGSGLVEEARRLGDRLNGHPERVPEIVPVLAGMLDEAGPDRPEVTAAVIEALGHAWDPSAAAVLVERIPPDHPSPAVRLALAQALPGGIMEPGPLREQVIDALTILTRDPQPRVRDWAAFGLGQVEADTPAVRDALAALLDDEDPDSRCEALLTLARTGDQRARAALLTRLDGDDQDLFRLELRAASALADPALHPALGRLSADWAEDDDEFTEPLRIALARCRPHAAAAALTVEKAVLDEIRRAPADLARADLRGSYPRTTLTLACRENDPPLEFPLWARTRTPSPTRSTGPLTACSQPSPTPPAEPTTAATPSRQSSCGLRRRHLALSGRVRSWRRRSGHPAPGGRTPRTRPRKLLHRRRHPPGVKAADCSAAACSSTPQPQGSATARTTTRPWTRPFSSRSPVVGRPQRGQGGR